MSKTRLQQPSTAERRQQLDDDLRRFLKSGKKIQKIPTGVSAQDHTKGRKHIVLGKPSAG